MNNIIKKDTIVFMTTLGVSSYNATVIFKALEDFDPHDIMVNKYLKDKPSNIYSDFFFYLERCGLVEEVICDELIIGEEGEHSVTLYPGKL